MGAGRKGPLHAVQLSIQGPGSKGLKALGFHGKAPPPSPELL